MDRSWWMMVTKRPLEEGMANRSSVFATRTHEQDEKANKTKQNKKPTKNLRHLLSVLDFCWFKCRSDTCIYDGSFSDGIAFAIKRVSP